MKRIFLNLFPLVLLSFGVSLALPSNDITKETLYNYSYRLSAFSEPVKLNGGETSIMIEGKEVKVRLLDFTTISKKEDGSSSIKAIALLLSIQAEGEKPYYELLVLIPDGGKLTQLNPYPLGEAKVKNWHGEWEVITSPPWRERWVLNLELELPNGEIESLSLCQRGMEVVSTEESIVRKPAIYIYPKRKESVKVKLKVKGRIILSDPPYDEEWVVEASPDGRLADGRRYLFYEALLNHEPKASDRGWVVRREELSAWFDEELPKLGLIKREIEDFKEYWLKELPPAPYYVIRVIPRELLDESIRLEVEPRPESIIRVFLQFEPMDSPIKIEPYVTSKPTRGGFIVVEWGGLIKERGVKLSKNQYETGLMLLRGIRIEGKILTIKVDSGGCTDKKSIEVRARERASPLKGYHHYALSFFRKVPDRCKAFFPEGFEISYDLEKELNLKLPVIISIENPIMPVTLNQAFYDIRPVQGEVKELPEELELKEKLLKATIKAVKAEIERYKSRVPPDLDKVAWLEGELERLKRMRLEDYPLPPIKHPGYPLNPGVIMPPIVEEIEIEALPREGELIRLTKVSKSGPFYHAVGIAKDAFLKLKPGSKPPFRAKVYIVFRREYFALIPDYHVYVSEIYPKEENNP